MTCIGTGPIHNPVVKQTKGRWVIPPSVEPNLVRSENRDFEVYALRLIWLQIYMSCLSLV